MNNEKEPVLRFKPVTDGLGFHPFSDGLPYTPESKAPTGTGAVAAGRPAFVTNRMQAPKAAPSPAIPQRPASFDPRSASNGPTLRPEIPSASPNAALARLQKELQAIQSEKVRTGIQAGQRQIQAQAMIPVHYGFGYVLKRVFAFVLDTAFNLSLCASILSFALVQTEPRDWLSLSPWTMGVVAAFLFLCNWAIIAAQEVAFGTSIGKRVFGLKLGGSAMEVAIRALLFLPALLVFGLGIAMCVFDRQKRCFHDRLTGLQP